MELQQGKLESKDEIPLNLHC